MRSFYPIVARWNFRLLIRTIYPQILFLNMLADYNLNRLDGAERSARKSERLDSLHQLPQAFLILAAVLDRKRDFAGEADQRPTHASMMFTSMVCFRAIIANMELQVWVYNGHQFKTGSIPGEATYEPKRIL